MEQQKTETAGAASAEAKSAIDEFAAQIGRLKELDLTGIEPLLPPTYKAFRYASGK